MMPSDTGGGGMCRTCKGQGASTLPPPPPHPPPTYLPTPHTQTHCPPPQVTPEEVEGALKDPLEYYLEAW